MGKAMCKVSTEKYTVLLNEKKHKYECKKCGRISHKEERLCKPVKIKTAVESHSEGDEN